MSAMLDGGKAATKPVQDARAAKGLSYKGEPAYSPGKGTSTIASTHKKPTGTLPSYSGDAKVMAPSKSTMGKQRALAAALRGR